MEGLRYGSALAAAIVGGFLFAHVAARAPRNIYTFLMGGIFLCIHEWNLFEWLRFHVASHGPAHLQMVGITLLPTLFFHFALKLAEPDHRARWLVPPYGSALALLAMNLGGLVDRRLDAFFDSPDWYLALLPHVVPFSAAGIVLLARRWASSPRESRGIFAFPLVAAIVAVPLGVTEAVVHLVRHVDPPLGNVGIAAAAGVFWWGITRHREIFDSLARLRLLTNRLLEALRYGILSATPGGDIVYANDAAVALLGTVPKNLQSLPQEFAKVAGTGEPDYVKLGPRVLRVDALRSDSPVPAESRAFVLLADVTREYELLHELAQRESLASLGEAAATLAHELRNPVAAVQATVDALSPGTPVDAGAFERLRGQTARVRDLLDQSLALARPITPDLASCDLNALVGRIVARSPHAARIRTSLAPDLPPVRVDPDMTGQVIDNLVRNAVEAGAAEVELATARNGNRARVVVRNRGPRIPPEVLGRLFHPFVTTKAAGTGLGLALCRKIVVAHGGEIGARNLPDGVEFEVRLPWTS
jgi:signal transduction histidine kinase